MHGATRLIRTITLHRGFCRAMAAWLCAMAVLGHAEPIQQRLATGLIANAEYHRGDGRQAVLLLHGFLATHHFPTIQRLVADLHEDGYTVLAPTLTLGINDRRTSLPCTALHLHTMAQTIKELGWWVDWLAVQGIDSITLLGHSAGSVQILAYTLDRPHPAVRRQILTSLVSLERLPDAKPEGASADQARAWLAGGDRRIARYDVSFCHGNFTAPPDVYLSYHAWSRQRIAAALRDTKVPATVIMGANDQRFTGMRWMAMLQASAPQLVVLPEANHFFDGMAEFALLDSIGTTLEAQVQGSTGE